MRASGMSTPPQRVHAAGAKRITASRTGAAPATTSSDASPPQISSISCVAASMPSSADAGSTPRSKR